MVKKFSKQQSKFNNSSFNTESFFQVQISQRDKEGFWKLNLNQVQKGQLC